MELFDEIEELTRRLVAVRSVNGTSGEREVADFLERELRSIPYWAAHPEQVIRQELPGDALGRANIFAWLHGTKRESNRTILLHGHIDTVGIEDFGQLEPWATDCEQLLEKLLALDLPQTMRAELESGDWLPGRGACDMKSGDAVFIVLLRYLSEHLETFAGNILLSLNPVEENQHAGIMAGLDVLEELQEKYDFDYVLAINNDYICPLYDDDPHRYIYAGAVGKLLPCFYVQGLETHVGQCFEGFDASAVIAEVVGRINYNTELCDGYHGEYTLPPSVLKMGDLKTAYNVQTAKEAWAYFNLFVHDRQTAAILQELMQIGRQSMKAVAGKIRQGRKAYSLKEGIHEEAQEHSLQVMNFSSLWDEVTQRYGRDAVMEKWHHWLNELQGEALDSREISLQLVRRLAGMLDCHEPLMVVFFAGPYCPYNTLHDKVPAEREILDQIRGLLPEFSELAGAPFAIKQFFPSLSDSSYLKSDDSPESIRALQQNFPAMEKLYPIPLERISRLQIPALDFGCYGKDAHKWSERVYKPYSFAVLPKMLLKTMERFLG